MSMRMVKMLFLAMASMATKWLVGEKQAPEATPTAGELAADEANILELDESDKAIEGSIKEDLLDGLPSRYRRGASDRSIRKGKFFWKYGWKTRRA